MACWVVPALAAEMQNVSVNEIMHRIQSGQLPTKTELGFTLVDVAPNSPTLPPKAVRREMTYTPIQRPVMEPSPDSSTERRLEMPEIHASRDQTARLRKAPAKVAA